MKRVIILTVAFVLLANVLYAGTIRHDVPGLLYTTLADSFPSVGDLLWLGYRGSGTLIAPNWVLTAAHVLDGGSPASSYSFNLTDGGGGIYYGDEIFINPGWTASLNEGYDIGLLRLSSYVTTVTPATLSARTDEVGHWGTHVGYGRTGTGLTGDTLPSGTKRAGNNDIDITGLFSGYTDRVLLDDFDNPANPLDSLFGSPFPLGLEYMIAPGDSGGGLFIDFGDGLGPVLAGVHSFLGWVDGAGNADYGDIGGSTRVSSFYSWIDDTMAVPIPAPALLLGSGLALILGFRRRFRKS